MPSSVDSTPETRISEAERRPSARVGAVLFRHRGWLPVPFLLVPLLAHGSTDAMNWILGLVFIVMGEAIRLAGVAAARTVTRRMSGPVQSLIHDGAIAVMVTPPYVWRYPL